MKTVFAALAAMVLAGPVAALTVMGLDAPDGTPIPDIGTLDPGINTISGSIAGECMREANDGFAECSIGALRFDRFRFAVPVGSILSAVDITTAGTGPDYLPTRTTLSSITFVPGGFLPDEIATSRGDINTTYDGLVDFGAPVGPFPAGTYRYRVGMEFFSFFAPISPTAQVDPYALDWTVALTVTPLPTVPVPASGVLLGAAGLMLIGLRRRQRRG